MAPVVKPVGAVPAAADVLRALHTATRPLSDFIDDLSTWYVRRSRDRIRLEAEQNKQQEGSGALATLRQVLKITAQVMAPAMPFFADDLWRRLRDETELESVHLTAWPEAGAVEKEVIESMRSVRNFATIGLQQREAAKLKLRQPLQKFTINQAGQPLAPEYVEILKDELNVKEIAFVDRGADAPGFELDTTLTPALIEEGTLRNIIRSIQAWRKEQNLTIADRPVYTLAASDEESEVARKYRAQIVEETNLADLRIE